MKYIGFYGHSNCAYRSSESFLDILASNIDATIVNTGVRQGSEERILFELKKTKQLDLAIIFHCDPQFLFLPDCDRDFGLNNITQLKLEYLFAEWNNPFWNLHHKRFKDKFKDPEFFYNLINNYKNFLTNPDLQKNRFYGSLIQIDQYLTAKKIPTIHIPNKNIPNWFQFSSGYVDTIINQYITKFKTKPNEWFVNNINVEGNFLIALRLTELAEKLFSSSPGDVAQ